VRQGESLLLPLRALWVTTNGVASFPWPVAQPRVVAAKYSAKGHRSLMMMALWGRSRSDLAEPRREISGQIGAKAKIVLVLLVQMTADLGFCQKSFIQEVFANPFLNFLLLPE
jgi:hypothetical protein